jgi:hypothetical protein
MRTAILTVVFAMLASCSRQAPPTRRLVHDPPIDVVYMHDVYLPAHGGTANPELVNSIAQLERYLSEFDWFMHDVERGSIPVREDFKGDWTSSLSKPDGSIVADYTDELGPILSFQKHQHKYPRSAIYMFQFGASGYIERVDFPIDAFDFDDHGRLIKWHGRKLNIGT